MTDEPVKIPPRLADLFARLGPPPTLIGDLPEPEPDFMNTEAVIEFNRSRALTWHAKHADGQFRRFRESAADHPQVLDWVGRYLLDPGFDSLMLQGVVGCGKTHQAFGAFRAIAESGRPPVGWKAVAAAELYRRLRPNGANDQAEILASVCEAPLLLFDDLGAARPSPFVEEVTYQVVDARYRACLPTIVTTNLGTDQLFEAVGYRTTSRLIQMCTWVQFPNIDLRRNS
jgi:DNA replication protein DnaC